MLQIPDGKLRLRGEVLSRQALPSFLPAWEDLCSRVIEDNVYYAPRYACSLIDNLERNTSLRFAAVWQTEKLVALLPITLSKFNTPFLSGPGRAWQTDYTYSCTPLLDQACCSEAASALVELLGTINEGEWVLPVINSRGPAYGAMIEALEKCGRPRLLSNSFFRAALKGGASFDAHMEKCLSSKRRRDLARNRRRLEEIGPVAHESHCSGPGLDDAVTAFLEIEARGWKGRRGSALSCRAETRKFAFDTFTASETESICRADVLTLNGVPIAVSLAVLAGTTAFTVKCAYDEAYRSYSAGLLLEVEVIRSFLSERWADRLDGATDGAHVIDNLWPGRVEVADLLFSLAPRQAPRRLRALEQARRAKRYVKTVAKTLATPLFGR